MRVCQNCGIRSASVLPASVLDRSVMVASSSMLSRKSLRCSFGCSSPMLWQAVLCCGGGGVSICVGTAKGAGKLAPALSAFLGALGALGFISCCPFLLLLLVFVALLVA